MNSEASQGRTLRCHIVLLVFLALVGVAVVMNINTGSVRISPLDIIRIVFFRQDEGSTLYGIIWNIRLPRLLAAGLFGGALSVSGYLLQSFFQNPIAGPFVLGISSGARLFVGIAMIFLMRTLSSVPLELTILAAFMGSMVVVGFVMLFARKARNMSMLLVIGIMIGYICSALTDLCITFAKESDIVNLTNWSLGSFSGARWSELRIAAVLIFVGVVAAFMLSKPIAAYQLGEGYARSLGIHIPRFRLMLILVSSMLSAIVTAFSGPISFVGIAVPHITRLAMNTSRPIYLIPGAFLGGAVFCMLCDLLARTAFAPSELAIGTVTAAFGAPIVIWLMLQRQERV